jgi:hypothetical protein
MSDWGQGYQTDIPYTVGFYRDLAPVHIEGGRCFFLASKPIRSNPAQDISNSDAVTS